MKSFVAVLGFVALFIVGLARPVRADNDAYFLYAGSFNRPTPETTSAAKGIYAWRFDPATGALVALGLMAETVNAAHLCVSPDQAFIYAVNWATGDPAGDTVSAYAVDRKTGALALLNRVSSHGASPNQIALDPSGRIAIAVNFHGGNVAAFAVGKNGRLGEAFYVDQHEGSAPAPSAQEVLPHPHGVAFSPDGHFVYIADLGLDRLYTYRLEAEEPRLRPADPAFVALQPSGTGPRRLQVHPNGRFLYVAHQTSSEVSAYRINEGRLLPLQNLSAQPADFKGKNSPSELLLSRDGRALYVGNRGAETVGWFSVDAVTGRLTLGGHVSAGGKNPRNLGLDPTGRYLIVSDQGSDRLVVLALDPVTGLPSATGQGADIVQPAGVCFVKVVP